MDFTNFYRHKRNMRSKSENLLKNKMSLKQKEFSKKKKKTINIREKLF